MELLVRHPFDPDWRAAALPGRRVLFAATRALAGAVAADARESRAQPAVAVLARVSRRGRCLEVVCAGPIDVVSMLAPVAGRFGAELVVRHVDGVHDPALRAALRRGAVVVAGRLDAPVRRGLTHAPA